jgi:hypothetical protein
MDRRTALKAAAGMFLAKAAFGQGILQETLARPEYSKFVARLKQEAKELSDIFTKRTGREYNFEISFGLSKNSQAVVNELYLINKGADRYEFAVPLQPRQNTAPDRELFLQLAEIELFRNTPQREYVTNFASDNPATVIQTPARNGYGVVEMLEASIPYTAPSRSLADLAKFDAQYDWQGEGKNRFSMIHYYIASKASPLGKAAFFFSIAQNEEGADYSFPFFQELLTPRSEEERIVAEALKQKLAKRFTQEQLPMDLPRNDQNSLKRSFTTARTVYLSNLNVEKKTGLTQTVMYDVPDPNAHDGYYYMILERKKGRMLVTSFSDDHPVA